MRFSLWLWMGEVNRGHLGEMEETWKANSRFSQHTLVEESRYARHLEADSSPFLAPRNAQ